MNSLTELRSPAEVYDECFVPALFAHWGPVVAQAARVGPGDRVLDVGCGTGTLTLAAAELAGPEGKVIGLDASPEMLAVARRKPAAVEWLEGAAEALPLPDRTFEAVVSQFALMFFDDRTAALREMARVLAPGGRLAVAVCDAVERSPGYSAFARLLDRLFGSSVGEAFRAPFVLGDPGLLQNIAQDAGLPDSAVTHHCRKVRFDSVASMVSTERACVWTLGGLLDEEQFARLSRECGRELQPFLTAEGAVVFDMPALILTNPPA